MKYTVQSNKFRGNKDYKKVKSKNEHTKTPEFLKTKTNKIVTLLIKGKAKFVPVTMLLFNIKIRSN
jgi:hypothetical protein